MSYIDKDYLSTQFDNFAKRIKSVFASKEELNACAYSLVLSEDGTSFVLKTKDNTVLSTVEVPITQITWNE